MSQHSIEILIGRLITDELFRDSFVMNRSAALQRFQDNGHELTAVEINATPVHRWREVATHIDVRLQTADLSKQVE